MNSCKKGIVLGFKLKSLSKVSSVCKLATYMKKSGL